MASVQAAESAASAAESQVKAAAPEGTRTITAAEAAAAAGESPLRHEVAELRAALPAENIETCCEAFVAIVLARTPHNRVRMRILLPERYPAQALAFELSSPTLPKPLLKRLTKQCEELASKNVGKPQLMAPVEHVRQTMADNLLLYAFGEVRQVVKMMEGKGTVGVNHKTGLIKLRMEQGRYFATLSVRVPNEYPTVAPSLTLGKSNFAPAVLRMFESQGNDLLRRCAEGYTAEQARFKSNPIQLPSSVLKYEQQYSLSSEALRGLDQDVRKLKQVGDLRKVDQEKRRGLLTHGTKERKAARRELRKLTKAEVKREAEADAAARKAQQDQLRALSARPSSDDGQPSVAALVSFFLHELVVRLPQEKCQVCKKPIFPADPAVLQRLLERGGADKPLRVYCGEWFHYGCMDQDMTTPPFGKSCRVCGQRLYHPDWPATAAQLEKAWAMKQAREREIAEVTDFMGVVDFGSGSSGARKATGKAAADIDSDVLDMF